MAFTGAVAGGGRARRPAMRSLGVLFLSRAGLGGSVVGLGRGGGFQCPGEAVGELPEAVGEHVAGEFEDGIVLLMGDGGDAVGVQQ